MSHPARLRVRGVRGRMPFEAEHPAQATPSPTSHGIVEPGGQASLPGRRRRCPRGSATGRRCRAGPDCAETRCPRPDCAPVHPSARPGQRSHEGRLSGSREGRLGWWDAWSAVGRRTHPPAAPWCRRRPGRRPRGRRPARSEHWRLAGDVSPSRGSVRGRGIIYREVPAAKRETRRPGPGVDLGPPPGCADR